MIRGNRHRTQNVRPSSNLTRAPMQITEVNLPVEDLTM